MWASHSPLLTAGSPFKRGTHCKEGLCLLLIWPFLHSLSFPLPFSRFYCDTARGETWLWRLRQARPSQALRSQIGSPLACTLPSAATARRSRYKLYIVHPEEEVWKAQTQSQLLNRTSMPTDCEKLNTPTAKVPKPKSNTNLFHVWCEERACPCLAGHLWKPLDWDMKDVRFHYMA